ncbi:MAG TPA: NYN domain-containing protein, partial [Hyphomicrobiaceae bacterium]|nr:NYN domain-containing protein [Hyphomicrobiaceae bacterium]
GPSLDHIVIFTGDGDFRALMAALQESGKRVSVVSTLQTQPPMVADELRRQADQFIDLADLEQMIGRDQGRPQSRAANARPSPARNVAEPARFDDEDDVAEEV